ncbi:MAG TPA: helix-turn-helix transcriptional regulator, partial [Steroidobacteraceae bacterium]|nr:helix-turn-helix transcriptional regulator [Steroidobacteraceae bacterium]
LGVSVYHLCRTYRRATGATLWSQIQQLRARQALLRLADGERDLTALGLSLGYSHHSHFTASFRREIGLTPSNARRQFESGSLSYVRELLAR